jgi:hypothetical protein
MAKAQAGPELAHKKGSHVAKQGCHQKANFNHCCLAQGLPL